MMAEEGAGSSEEFVPHSEEPIAVELILTGRRNAICAGCQRDNPAGSKRGMIIAYNVAMVLCRPCARRVGAMLLSNWRQSITNTSGGKSIPPEVPSVARRPVGTSVPRAGATQKGAEVSSDVPSAEPTQPPL